MLVPNKFAVKVDKWAGYNKAEKDKAKAALVLFELIFNKHYFPDLLLNFKNTVNEPQFSGTSLSNFEVMMRLYAAQEIGSTANYTANLNLYMENGEDSNPNALGYYKAGKIWTYRKRFRESNMTIAKLSGHYAHEWCHALGFEHPENKQDSVPYAIGNLVMQEALLYQ